MKQIRHQIIRAGLDALHFTGAHYLLQPVLGGVGMLFMLHHVRPGRDDAFQPNSHLEITPDFLRATLKHVRDQGLDVVSLDEMHRRLRDQDFSRRFACFTFDDGYRDNRDFALPVMREFDAPFAVYVTTEFAAGVGRAWWITLEMLIASANMIEAAWNGATEQYDTSTLRGKTTAFNQLHDWLRSLPDDQLRREMTALCARHGFDETSSCRDLCMSWDELKPFADDPLVTIGAHTISHPQLAKLDLAAATHELQASRAEIEQMLQRPVAHLAYPYGDQNAAFNREYALAASSGYRTAVTTRPGMIFPDNATAMTALPRISLNGDFQNLRYLRVLTSGAATAFWNGFGLASTRYESTRVLAQA